MASKREVELARHLRRQATDAEKLAWEMLRARRCNGLKFKREEPLGDFIVDFYCPQLKLVIELDGAIHAEPDQAERDELRTAALEALGLTVIQVRNEDVAATTFDRIVTNLTRSPSPRVSVERGLGGEAWRAPEPRR
ncbi:MAG TPA: endonuclease domain-containing protein [Gemmatimonadales bacterium]|nr:endonuclease domain-containing protein [Gemmatimonadales bacterium]